MYYVPLVFQCIYTCSENGDGRKWRLLAFLFADDWVLCGKSEGDLRAMVGFFPEVHRRADLKVNADKSKVVLLNGENGLE